jgi:hypothetical protein
MEQTTKAPSRKKFLLWGAAIFSSFTVLNFWGRSKKKNTETVKMLTRDGRLVEIDKTLLTSSGKKITNDELQNWVKK